MPRLPVAVVCLAMSLCMIAPYGRAESPAIDNDATVTEIIEALIKSHGGNKSSKLWKCGIIEFTTSEGIVPSGMGAATVTESFCFPNFFKRSIDADSPGGKIFLTFVVNKNGSWMTSPGKPTVTIPRPFADREQHAFAAISTVSHLRDYISNLTVIKKLDIDGHPAIQLRLESDQETGDFFVDVQSGLLVGTARESLDPITKKPIIISTRLRKYTNVDGIPVPLSFSSKCNGKKMLEVTITKLEFKDSLPDSTFAKPK